MTDTVLRHQHRERSFVPSHLFNASQHTFLRKITIGEDDEPNKTVAAARRPRGRPRKVDTNALKLYLQDCSPGHALSKLPEFDNIVTGAVNLDLGDNARPLSKRTVIAMLRRLDVISTATVQQYMHMTLRHCCERHAQKIAQCLRVIQNASMKVAESYWPKFQEIGQSYAHGPANYIAPCGNSTCVICAAAPVRGSQWAESVSCRDDENNFVIDDDDNAEQVPDWRVAD